MKQEIRCVWVDDEWSLWLGLHGFLADEFRLQVFEDFEEAANEITVENCDLLLVDALIPRRTAVPGLEPFLGLTLASRALDCEEMLPKAITVLSEVDRERYACDIEKIKEKAGVRGVLFQHFSKRQMLMQGVGDFAKSLRATVAHHMAKGE